MTSTAERAGGFDLGRAYRLGVGVVVVQRDDDSLQIGLEPPRCRLLRHAPADARAILNELSSGVPPEVTLARHDADPLVWTALLAALAEIGLIVPADPEAHTFAVTQPAEHAALEHRLGGEFADRAMRARADSLVVVHGAGRIACDVAATLAIAGIGHVHHLPDRPVRPVDLPDGAALPAGRPAPGTAIVDGRLLAERLRLRSPTVRVSPSATHLHPNLAIIALDGPPPSTLGAELVADCVPHLCIYAGRGEAVVGPLVLPGRSSCLLCAERHRTEIDPAWPDLARLTRSLAATPPVALAGWAAAVGVGQALGYLDGLRRPATLGGTLHLAADEIAPRRRSWPAHPECGCGAARLQNTATVPRGPSQ